LINARAETVAEKPAFRHPFRTRQCLVVADGFYEWQRQDGWKRPFFVHVKDDRPFAFASLWKHCQRDEEPIYSCDILTTDANELLAPIRDWMPVIPPEAAYDLWLNPVIKNPRKLRPLLVPDPVDAVEACPVGTLVNSPANDVEGCIERVA
jgi:putative SOS response-associated peptidase YedK